MIIDREKRFVFVHNPRTGGTTIRRAIAKRVDYTGVEWGRQSVPVLAAWQKTPQSKLGLNHWSHANLCIEPVEHWEEYGYIFVCVRNPYARLFSWYNKITMPSILDEYLNPERWMRPKERNFLRFIKRIYNHYKDDNLPAIWEQPQSFWTNHESIDEIIRFEDLANQSNWDDLIGKCGLQSIERPHENQTDYTNKDYKKHYTSEMMEMVQEMFQEELEEYNYEF